MLNRMRRGYSLLELVIASGLLGLVLAYVTTTFGMQYNTYTVVDQVSETQGNTRVIAALIERDVRNAGYMVPSFAAACGSDSIDAPDVLIVSDAAAIRPVDQLPIELRGDALHAEVVGTPTAAGQVITLAVDDLVVDQDPTYDTDGNGANDSDYQIGGGVIVVDGANPERGITCGVLSDVQLGSNTLIFDIGNTGLSSTTPFPPELWVVPAIAYQIVTPMGQPSELRRNGQPLAYDVEDLQVAWFFDDDDDGEVDALEYRAAASTIVTPGGTIAVTPGPSTFLNTTTVNGNDLREIRVSLVVRSRGDDPRNPNTAGRGQRLENRTMNIPQADGRRRRIHTATIRLRNVS